MAADADRRWRASGCSVRGASHERAAVPNQDAIAWLPQDGDGETVVLVLADGHGSEKCFRSQSGAQLAVKLAVAELRTFAAALPRLEAPTGSAVLVAAPDAATRQLAEPTPDVSMRDLVLREATERLPTLLVQAWRQAVAADVAEQPFTGAELERLLAKKGADAVAAVHDNPPLAYGATLVAVAVTPRYILYLQLGDGDILAVSPSGEVIRPMAADERLLANETTSLCGRDAASDFRVEVVALEPGSEAELPALILVSTDGYSNSFKAPSGFEQAGVDLLDLVRERGLGFVAGRLKTWLAETSQQGSGDDITVGLIKRVEAGEHDQVEMRLSQLEGGQAAVEARLEAADADLLKEANARQAEASALQREVDDLHDERRRLVERVGQLESEAAAGQAAHERLAGQTRTGVRRLTGALLLAVCALGAAHAWLWWRVQQGQQPADSQRVTRSDPRAQTEATLTQRLR